MSETVKHTPGPWFAAKSKQHRVCAGAGDIIAQAAMPPARMHKKAWHEAKETSHANARLIAAAPDMLEALHNALAAGLPDVVADAVRAAIDKATGGSHDKE